MWDRFLLRMPIVGKIILKGALARFARSFALSTRSGVPIVQTFHVVAQTVDNVYIARRVEQMRDSVERGESIRAPPPQRACSRPSCCRWLPSAKKLA